MMHEIFLNRAKFKAVDDGLKKAIILDNSKRGIQKGDLVTIQETEPMTEYTNIDLKGLDKGLPTGLEILTQVTYVDIAKQQENYAVVSISVTYASHEKEE